jgi:MFS family permease
MQESGDPRAGSTPRPGLRAIPRGIWALGFVSLFMDVSSEMIHALLPVFLTTVLGASVVSVGWIEGLAEATASITKIFSGTLSDFLGRRKLLAVIGYGLAALTKPLFPLAHSVTWVVTARFLDRVGKGIRGAPRDALVAEIAPPAMRGASYGLRQALDTVGAFAGPLLATLLMVVTGDAFRIVFWIAVIPAFVSLAVMVLGVREPEQARASGEVHAPIRAVELRGLAGAYWWVVAAAGVFTLARFSEAFLILRAQSVGLSIGLLPLVLVVMNVAYAGSAYPMGRLSDRVDRRNLLAVGFGVLALAQLVLALANGVVAVAIGVLLWGLHMGMTQGILAALVADTTPERLRGTAFGVFHLVSGLAMLAASVMAGWLWQSFGPSATFFAGAGLSVVAVAGFAGILRSVVPDSESGG